MGELLKCPAGSKILRASRNPIRYRLYKIKDRCKRLGIEFDLKTEDIVIPDLCPLLEIPLIKYTDKGHGSREPGIWSIDRKDPTKGYTKDNVWVISLRANILKRDATLKELELLVDNFRKKIDNKEE